MLGNHVFSTNTGLAPLPALLCDSLQAKVSAIHVVPPEFACTLCIGTPRRQVYSGQ